MMMSILWIYLLYCIVAPTEACDPPRGWTSKTIIDRANEANTVVIGKILSTREGDGGGPCSSDTECGYWANVLVECVIRDNSSTIDIGSSSNSIRVTGFGLNSDCTETTIQKNAMYILLIKIHGNVYTLEEVNEEPAAERVTTRSFESYVNQIPGAICRQPETTILPTTTKIPTTRQARTATAKFLGTTMNWVTTKLNKKKSNQGLRAKTKPMTTAISASSKSSLSFLTFTTMIFTLFVAI